MFPHFSFIKSNFNFVMPYVDLHLTGRNRSYFLLKSFWLTLTAVSMTKLKLLNGYTRMMNDNETRCTMMYNDEIEVANVDGRH